MGGKNALPSFVALHPRVQAVSDGAPAAGAENGYPGARVPGPSTRNPPHDQMVVSVASPKNRIVVRREDVEY